ncbi:hypothetical protein L5515_017408 [Caenorhabditis briggsae]|uniref:Uncharacterized protein n=1 Tax=Caenorhabditis briggsae TaxID=6238 RepID=A0AAE9FGT1_CAEBR|nr:hypothetical protein L3Y34_011532 [Caenorhabditis briggsae]UMM40921.1 hypothetical protein L5515_017408 [Caenorhabditis briggsae]
MGRIRNITIGVILFVLFTGYCWILKNRPTKTESLIFRETNMLPDLTFSKLADLENQMVVELDAVSMEEYEKIRNPNFQSEVITNYSSMQVVVFVSFSVAGIVVIICVARRFYLQDDYEIDLERVPSTSVLSSQEKLFQGYKTTQN